MPDTLRKRTVLELTEYLGVTRPDLVRYATCYNIDLKSFCYNPQDYFGSYLEIYEDSFEFFINLKQDIVAFNEEFFQWKSVDQLCKSLKIDLVEFSKFYTAKSMRINLFYSNTQPVFNPPKEINSTTKVKNISTQYLINLYYGFPLKTSRQVREVTDRSIFQAIIGYSDVKESVIDLLNPILDIKALDLWGLRKPGGIILFGPPGCGKTFWAEQIANYLNYEFKEIPRSLFASSYVDGAAKNLKEILDNTESRTALFFDEFDSVAESRTTSSSGSRESIKVVNTLLQEIPKLINRDIVIIAATNYLSRIDAAVIRPGRFDLKIPIFPPNQSERAQLIFQKLTKDLPYQSPLTSILENNNIISSDYFINWANKMTLFSTSLLEDFVDILKRKIKYLYDSGIHDNNIIIDDFLLEDCITKSSAKLVSQDLEFIANFYLEVSSFVGSGVYKNRLQDLKDELGVKFIGSKNAPQPIGFRMPNIKK